MPEEEQVPATEPTVPATAAQEVEETTAPKTTETTETPEKAPTLAELQAQLEAERAKTVKAVEAEKKARTARQALETELTDFRSKAETQEAERVANLTLSERLAEETAKREAAEAEAKRIRGEWGDFRVTSQLEGAGFLTGLEGDARAAQLGTLKALTSLDFVQDDGAFSVEKFSARFGGLKPAVAPVDPPVPPEPPVVDLGGRTPPPAEQQVNRKQELLTLLETAKNRGQRSEVIAISRELANLK